MCVKLFERELLSSTEVGDMKKATLPDSAVLVNLKAPPSFLMQCLHVKSWSFQHHGGKVSPMFFVAVFDRAELISFRRRGQFNCKDVRRYAQMRMLCRCSLSKFADSFGSGICLASELRRETGVVDGLLPSYGP